MSGIYRQGKLENAPIEVWRGSPWEWAPVEFRPLPKGPERAKVFEKLALREVVTVAWASTEPARRKAQAAVLAATLNSIKKRLGLRYSYSSSNKGIVVTRIK